MTSGPLTLVGFGGDTIVLSESALLAQKDKGDADAYPISFVRGCPREQGDDSQGRIRCIVTGRATDYVSLPTRRTGKA